MTTFIEKFKPTISLITYYFEYIPIFLIFIYLSLKEEIHLNIFSTSLKFTITVFVIILFFFMVVNFPEKKFLILMISSFLWIIIIYLKNKILQVV